MRFVVFWCTAMTKLMQWLTCLFAFLAVWVSVLLDCLPVQLDSSSKEVVWMVLKLGSIFYFVLNTRLSVLALLVY